VRICVAVTLAAWASIAWGALEMHLEGGETLGSGLKIGLALLPGILGPFAAYNFWRGVKVFAAIRRGENQVARWTVPAAELAAFAAEDGPRNTLGAGHLNVWTPPRAPPAEGIEVVFAADGVLVGDTYFALVTTGPFKVGNVRLLAGGVPAIAFRTATVWANRFGSRVSIDALRIPVARAAGAEAERVLDHFRRVEAREIVVNPNFYRSRMRFGLFAAPFCFAAAAAGFAMKSAGYEDPDDIAGLLIGLGILLGGAMAILALAAWRLGRAQRRGR